MMKKIIIIMILLCLIGGSVISAGCLHPDGKWNSNMDQQTEYVKNYGRDLQQKPAGGDGIFDGWGVNG